MVCDSTEDFIGSKDRHLIGICYNETDNFVINEEKGRLIRGSGVFDQASFFLQSELTCRYFNDAIRGTLALPKLRDTRKTFEPVLKDVTSQLQSYATNNKLSKIYFT